MNLETEIKEKIIGLLTTLFPDAKIYLFGSRATGVNQKYSDIDIAIDNKTQIPLIDIDEANSIMEALNIPYKVDIVDFNHVSEIMRNSIIKEGILWKN